MSTFCCINFSVAFTFTIYSHVDYPQIMRLAKEIFIENLKALRTARGLSQAKLAEMADLSPSIVSDKRRYS